MFLGWRRFCHLPIYHSLDRQWLLEDLQEVALPTPSKQQLHMLSVIRQKRANLETGVSRNQSTPSFSKNEHFLPPDTHTMWKDTNSPKQRDIAAKKILTLLAEATIKAATKEKTCDFYFKNKDLDLIADEFLCHHPCCKSFTIGYSCSFRKASPMIIFGKALNYPLSIVSLGLFNADWSICKASKNKLAPILMSKSNEENTDA